MEGGAWEQNAFRKVSSPSSASVYLGSWLHLYEPQFLHL